MFRGRGELNHFSNKEWEETYTKYKAYFDKRTVSKENPNGQYIIEDKKDEAKAEDTFKEVGEIKAVDNSAEAIAKIVDEQMEAISPELAEAYREVKAEEKEAGMKEAITLESLKEEAKALGIKYSGRIGIEKLAERIDNFKQGN